MPRKKIKVLTFREHVKSKSMWLGSSEVIEFTEWLLADGDRQTSVKKQTSFKKFVKEQVEYSPALYKCIDEILVNACDHWANHVSDSNCVTKISCSFDIETGAITIMNDGPGIEVRILSENNKYTVETIATKEFSGTNLDKDPDRVVGGVNGLGMKLVVILSQRFEIETTDVINKKYYRQVFEDNCEIINEPTVVGLRSVEGRKLKALQRRSHTKITFLPDYETLGYASPSIEHFKTIEKLIEMRLYQIKTFIAAVSAFKKVRRKCAVKWQGKEIKLTGLKDFTSRFLVDSSAVACAVAGKKTPYPWDICVGLSDGAHDHISIVNGICAKDGGSHMNYIKKQIIDGLMVRIKRMFKGSSVRFTNSLLINKLFISMTGQITNPQWEAQTKGSLKAPRGKFKEYTLDSKFFTALWKVVEPALAATFMAKELKDSNKTSTGPIKKYKKAEKAGTREWIKCKLFIPEGDSAERTVKRGITSNPTLSYKYCGLFNIQGVPMNARKEVDIRGGHTIRKKKLQDNERLSGLVAALGLRYDYTYELNAAGNKEFASLKYGMVIVAVDQDLDGIGNIFGLLLNFFALFWPALIKRGFIKRLATPVIRAYPARRSLKVKEFYSEADYESWVERTFSGRAVSGWTVKFYKGLATHTPRETKQMFSNYDKTLFTYCWDDGAATTMEIYYGKVADKRKRELSTPVSYDDTPLDSDLQISCTKQLRVETKAFQFDVIARKMPSAVDGLVPSRRKVLAGARCMFKKSNKLVKVYQLAGYVAKKMHYHHGEASLNGTIIKMAQNFIGACNIPFLIPSGEFGDRTQGTSEAGSPRYIETQLNRRLVEVLFPPQDDWLLPYAFTDGEQSEPLYYVPILPMAVLEHCTTTSVGWKITVWARDFAEVLANVRARIAGKRPKAALAPWIIPKYDTDGKLIPNKMEIRQIPARAGAKQTYETCVGWYESYTKRTRTVHITELPLRVWSTQYCDKLAKKAYVESVRDDSGEHVDIHVRLESGGYDKIEASYGDDNLDPLESYLQLKQSLRSHLNMVAIDGAVKEFTSYNAVISYWFPIRQKLYQDRIDREKVLLRLQIEYYKNLIRFVADIKKINLLRMEEEEAGHLLKKRKFVKFNHVCLFNPQYIPVEKLEHEILVNNASYKYLLTVTQMMILKKAVAARQAKLEELEKRLKYLSGKTWKDIWLAELEALEKIVREGIKTRWMFGQDEYKY